MTLLIFSEDPALAGLSSPLVEQLVTIHQFLNVGWFSFDLDIPLNVSAETDTLFVGLRQNADLTYELGYYMDTATDDGDKFLSGNQIKYDTIGFI